MTASEAIEQLLGAQSCATTGLQAHAFEPTTGYQDPSTSASSPRSSAQIDVSTQRKENVIFLGPPGVGKTHLAISLEAKRAQSLLRRSGRPHHLARRSQDRRPAGTPPQHPHLSLAPSDRHLPVSQSGAMFFFQLINRRPPDVQQRLRGSDLGRRRHAHRPAPAPLSHLHPRQQLAQAHRAPLASCGAEPLKRRAAKEKTTI